MSVVNERAPGAQIVAQRVEPRLDAAPRARAEELGHTGLSGAPGEEGPERPRDPRIDVVMLDLGLPGIQRQALLRHLDLHCANNQGGL